MPGTIQVSVFDLVGLPSSSSSIKVSMGSKEHQIWDKGVFSFPLTTLREDLFVTLFNIDGVELSRTGVNTKVVVEKGVWDDIFPLEGGGHLRMKLQFILSKEDRNRIREMRETALKKKREELLLSSKRRSETEALSKVANDVTAAFDHQVTDSQGSIVQREAVSGAGRVNSESNPEDRKNVRQQYSTPNKTDGEAESSKEYRALSVAKPFKEQEVHLTETQRFMDNMVTKLPPNGVPVRPISSEDSVRYATIPRKLRKNEKDAAEETSLEFVPSQEHKALHVTEANQNVPLTIDTWSAPNHIIPRHSSLSSLSTIKHIDPEETPRSNQTTRKGTPSEATRQVPVNMDSQSPTSSITSISSSLQNRTDSATVRIALEKAVRNNETDSDGTSKASPKAPAKIDIQTPPNSIITQPKYSHNQIHSFASHTGTEKTFRNSVIDGEGTSSPTKPLEEIKASNQRETTPQVTAKTDIQSPQDVIPNRFIASKEYLRSSKFLLGRKSYSTSNLLEASQTSTNENQTAQKRTPSNEPQPRATALKLTPDLSKVATEVPLKVPNENEAAKRNKETKEQNIGTQLQPYSLKKPLEVNVQQNVSQISKVGKGTPLKETNINISKEEKSDTDKIIVGRELDSFSVKKNLEVNAQHTAIDDGLPNSQSTGNLEARAATLEENKSSEQVHIFTEHKKDNMSRQDISLKEITVTSEPETATLSGRALDYPAQKEYFPTEPQRVENPIYGQEEFSGEVSVTSETDTASISGRNPDDPVTRVLHHEQQGSSHNMIDKPENINTPGTPLRKRKSLEYLGVEQFHGHDMESWILPDERKRVCITTGDKKMMDFAECFVTSSERNQMNINSFRGDGETELAMESEISNEVIHTETESCDLMESRLERPRNDRFFAGPIGQAVRIALMVAFGTLVVVARQTRNR